MKDLNGNSCLHYAVMSANVDVFKLLKKYHLDINERNYMNYTPLHLAAKLNSPSILQLIIQTYQ